MTALPFLGLVAGLSLAPPPTSTASSSLAAALATALEGPTPLPPQAWLNVATLLRDTACELVDPAAVGSEEAAREACDQVLQVVRERAPSLFAVAKLSSKRNGDLSQRRALERCTAELGLLIGTFAALEEGEERQAFVDAARPLAQTSRTADRIRALLVLSRGFHTPGFGGHARTWRKGANTVHELIARQTRPEVGSASQDAPARSSAAKLERWLASAPVDVQRHSKALRGALPLLEAPLRLWLSRADKGGGGGEVQLPSSVTNAMSGASMPAAAAAIYIDDESLTASPGDGAAVLAYLLAAHCGDEGVRLAQAASRWVVDELLESIENPSGRDARNVAPPANVVARARGSDVARLLLVTHAPLVRGSSRQQKRWLSAVDRAGHAVWLMLLAACEALAPPLASGGIAEDEAGHSATPHADSEAAAALALERVRAVMLSCSLLERSDALRPKLRAALSRTHTSPEWLWQLLAGALSLEAGVTTGQDDGACSDGDGGGDRYAGTIGGVHVAAAASQLLEWEQPELVFKYLELHAADETIAPLARRWLGALLGLGDPVGGGCGTSQSRDQDGRPAGSSSSSAREGLHALRFYDPHNAAHFERLAACGEGGQRVVDAWIESELDAQRRWAEPETLFMMGEELRTCMRIDQQCVRENAALLGYLCQGHVRVLIIRDGDGGGDGDGALGEGSGDADRAGDDHEAVRGRVAARAVVRLLGRADTGEPILFVDQPLYGHHLRAGGDAVAADAALRAALDERLRAQARALAATTLHGVPVAMWDECVAPASDAAEAHDVAAAERAEAAVRSGRIALVEFDGVAPQVYSNLRGRLVRGTPAAMGLARAYREGEDAELPEQPLVEERVVVHAFASRTTISQTTGDGTTDSNGE